MDNYLNKYSKKALSQVRYLLRKTELKVEQEKLQRKATIMWPFVHMSAGYLNICFYTITVLLWYNYSFTYKTSIVFFLFYHPPFLYTSAQLTFLLSWCPRSLSSALSQTRPLNWNALPSTNCCISLSVLPTHSYSLCFS